MTLIERLLTAADLWAKAHGRSSATLASQVARDGKFFERLRSSGGCTTTVADRFFVFFRDPASWPDGVVPAELAGVLDGVDLGLHAQPDTAIPEQSSSGSSSDLSGRIAA